MSKKRVKGLLANGIYPVVPDLYRANILNWDTGPRKVKYFSVMKEAIRPLQIGGTEKVIDFLKRSFFAAEGYISLSPIGWKLQDELEESVTFRSFSTIAEQMILDVNSKDNSVMGIHIY